MSKILLVEDNAYNQDMLSKRLRRIGYEVVMANSGPEGIETAKSDHPDLILMDLGLPDMDGWEVTRRLKQNHVTAGIPIIALTAHALREDLERAIAAGCDHFETKPVMFDRLVRKIKSCLDRPTPKRGPAAR